MLRLLFLFYLMAFGTAGFGNDFDASFGGCPDSPIVLDTLYFCSGESLDLTQEFPTVEWPGGTILDPLGNILSGGLFFPSLDASGIYSYIVLISDSCTLHFELPITEGTGEIQVGDTALLCVPGSVFLISLIEDSALVLPPEGVWFGPDGYIDPSGVFDPEMNSEGDYLYEYQDVGECHSTYVLPVHLEEDSDGDSICDSDEISGCQDPLAENYDPYATDPGTCIYEFLGDAIDVYIEDSDDEWSGRPEFSIYPNPIKEGALIVSFAEPEPRSFRVFDLLGRLVFEGQANSEILRIPREKFPSPGIYSLIVPNAGRDLILVK